MRLLIVHSRAPEYAALIDRSVPNLDIITARSGREVPADMKGIDVILAWRFPKELLRRATDLRWLASTGAGVDHLLIPSLPEAVVVTKAPPIFSGLITEYVMGYILYLTLNIEEVLSNKRRKVWAAPARSTLAGKVIGVLGMGTIGSEVAKVANAFGMRTWGVRRTPRPSPDAEKMFGRNELESFLPNLDFLVVTLPLTKETQNMIGGRELSLLKPECWVVNVARGRIFDEESLAAALRTGKLGGYISDVFGVEPLPETSPLWELPNALITPHYGAITPPEEFIPYFVDNVRRYLRGEPLKHKVDRKKGY
ncbi:MAG: D-2-hydroxyacid dehydrogenase [Candidatus Eisenbacteria bacterium]|nr:D-2-hydroxyacid dehydrogenase [Candidatus Eisenbacteria bacterium]